MIDGSSWRVALVAILVVTPGVLAGNPTPILSAPSGTDGQEITDLAVDATGQFAMAVVSVDAGDVNTLPGLPVAQSKNDVYACDFGPVTASASAQSCVGARHAKTPGTAARLAQSVAATSLVPPGGTGLTARYAVGGPANRVSFWSGTEQASRWETTVDGDQPVLNVSINPNGTRVAAATDAPVNGGGRLFVYDATATSGSTNLKWSFDLVDPDGQKVGVRPRDMEFPPGGRYLAVGTTPRTGGDNGAVLFFDLQSEARPSAPAGKVSVRGAVTEIALSADGKAMVVGTTGYVYYFELPNGLPDPNRQAWARDVGGSPATAVAITGDGSHFAAAAGGRIHFYRHIADSSRIAESIGDVAGYAAQAPVADLAYDATGRLLVAVAGDKAFGFAAGRTTPMWTFSPTQAIHGGLDAPLTKVSVSQDAQRFVVAGRTKLMPYATKVAAALEPLQQGPVTATPGQIVPLQFRVSNSGSLEDEFELRAQPPAGWPLPSLSTLRLALPPGDEHAQTVFVNVTVPEGHQPGSFRVQLEAHASSLRNASRESRVASSHVDLNVPRSVSLVIRPSEERIEVRKGGEATLPVTFRNVGNAGGLVNLSVEQSFTRGSSWGARFEREQVQIDAGSEATVNLVLDAPADGLNGDKNVLTIVAREGAYVATHAVTAYIEPDFGASLEHPNGTIEFTRRAMQVVTVVLRNTGNADDAYNLTYSVGAGAVNDWTVELPSEAIEVPRGQSRNVNLRVTPNVAEPRAASLTLRAVSQGSLSGEEATLALNLVYREPEDVDDGGSFIPGPSPVLALALVALAAFAARRRLRGGGA